MADGTAHMALSLLLPKHLSLGDLQKLSQTSSHLRLALRAIPPAAWEPALHRSGLQLSKPLPADTDMVTCLGEAAGLLHLYRCADVCTRPGPPAAGQCPGRPMLGQCCLAAILCARCPQAVVGAIPSRSCTSQMASGNTQQPDDGVVQEKPQPVKGPL